MKNVLLVKTLCIVLVPCLLLLSYGCRTTSPTLNSPSEVATHSDSRVGLIVETVENTYYRFEGRMWQRDDQGNIRGSGTRHQSLLEANEDANGVSHTGVLEAGTIVRTYVPGVKALSTSGWIVVLTILTAFAVWAGIALAAEVKGCTEGCANPGYSEVPLLSTDPASAFVAEG